MTTNTGGPAFPLTLNGTAYDGEHLPQDGMTLRDYGAFKILPAVYAEYFAGIARGEYPCQEKWEDGIAIESYRIADAMLKARSK